MKKLLLILLAVLGLSGTAYAEDMTETEFLEFPSFIYKPTGVAVFNTSDVPSYDAIYQRIDEAVEKALENGAVASQILVDVNDLDIKSGDSLGTTVVDPTDDVFTYDELINIYCNYVYNNPTIGNLTTAWHRFIEDENGHCTTFRPFHRALFNEAYYNTLNNSQKQAYLLLTHNQEEYLKATHYAFSKAVSEDMTEVEKIISIHSYLTETANYSFMHSGAVDAEIEDEYDDATAYLVFTPYSTLVGDKQTVCQGYSLAFKMLCNMAGIECGYATTDGHIWNIVKCGDHYYHMDLTWDDTSRPGFYVDLSGVQIAAGCTMPHVMRLHMFMTDAESTEAHADLGEWTSDMPECTDSTLKASLFGGNLTMVSYPLYWESGNFYFQEAEHFYNGASHSHYHTLTDFYCKIMNNKIYRISDEEYLPDKKIEAKMYNSSSDNQEHFIAIDGTPNTSAKLYAAQFSQNRLVGVEMIDVAFDEYGKAVAYFPADTNKLMLFENGTITPIAYAK